MYHVIHTLFVSVYNRFIERNDTMCIITRGEIGHGVKLSTLEIFFLNRDCENTKKGN